MKNTAHNLLVIALLIVTAISVSCSSQNTELEDMTSNREHTEENLQSLYLQAMSAPTHSIIDVVKESNTLSSRQIKMLPCLSADDINVLNHMSISDLSNLRDSIKDALGATTLSRTDSIADDSYLNLYEEIGEEKGIQLLEDFIHAYLREPQGWTSICKLIPQTQNQVDRVWFIRTAVVIDKSIRPVYNALSNQNSHSRAIKKMKDRPDCKLMLEIKLTQLGIEMTAETFLDVMTGGGMIPPELLFTGIDLVDIWLDYEMCNGRVH